MADDFWRQEAANEDGIHVFDRLIASSSDEEYFEDAPIYDDSTFQRLFRVSREVSKKVFDTITAIGNFFCQKKDSTSKMDFILHQKVTAAFRILAYVIECFGPECLRNPTEANIKRLVKHSEVRGFRGCCLVLTAVNCCGRTAQQLGIGSIKAKWERRPVEYEISEQRRNTLYWLADGIYPK
eukprot:IDg4442t1